MTFPESEAIRRILARLRPRDRIELEEYGFDPDTARAALLAPSVLLKTFDWQGEPAAIIAFHPLTPRALVVSLLATEAWPHVARAVLRWGIRRARSHLLEMGYARAECRTMECYSDAIRFLERLGFIRECHVPQFGASGASFVQYAWRLNDHVPLQNPQGSPAATTAAPSGVAPGRSPARTPPPGPPPGPVHLAVRADTASHGQPHAA